MSQEWFDIPKSWLGAEPDCRAEIILYTPADADEHDERMNATKADKARLAVSQIIRTCGGNQNRSSFRHQRSHPMHAA